VNVDRSDMKVEIFPLHEKGEKITNLTKVTFRKGGSKNIGVNVPDTHTVRPIYSVLGKGNSQRNWKQKAEKYLVGE